MSGKKAPDQRQKRRMPQYRLDKLRRQSLQPPSEGAGRRRETMQSDAVVNCGWGRLFFAQTFVQLEDMVAALRDEKPGQRDIAFYLRDPHVALALAPQDLFLDPSHTYRLDLHTYRPSRRRFRGFHIRRLASHSDARAVNRIYAARNMVEVAPEFFWDSRDSRSLTYFIAVDTKSEEVLGTVTGIDHRRAFRDPENGSSLWCLAVDPQAAQPGIGEALVRRLAEHFQTRGRAFMDLSVLHDNEEAIALYEKLGFVRVPFFALKNKNAFNETLYIGPTVESEADLNPYARIIVDEARRRGIQVEILDVEAGYFRLSLGGRLIVCRESLSELTSAIALSRCDDKQVTRRLLSAAGLQVPAQMVASDREANEAFLKEHGRLVVKPARGEQGRGISVDIENPDDLQTAIDFARSVDATVLLEEFISGTDLRVIVIDDCVAAAAVRRPPRVVGDGSSTIRALIERQSRRRKAATGGESAIPIDGETERIVRRAGFALDDILPAERALDVRTTANLHTGGTMHDVTDDLHAEIREAAVACAKAIDIPVVGIDMVVPDPRRAEYWIIEANERPGLANHEPQPTAERFVDLLFPRSASPGGQVQLLDEGTENT